MSLDLIRETIKVNQVIGEDMAQAVVEHDIIVPDVKPDITRILLLDGEAFVNSTEVLQDKVAVNGMVHYKVLYVPEEQDQSIKSINTKAPFTYNLDILDAKPGMKCQTKCSIEHIDYNLLNGRKINVKTIVGVNGKILGESNQEMVTDLAGIENIQVMKENTKVNSYVGANEENFNVKETLEVPAGKPAIKELLRNDIKITGKDYKVTDNKIIAKGELNVSTLYVGDTEDRSIQYMEHEIPFTQFIDLPEVNEESSCQVEYRIADSVFEAGEDSDGEFRLLNGEVELGIQVSAYNKRTIEVVQDAFSPRIGLTLDKEPFRIEEIVSESRNQMILKDTVVIPEGSPDIAEVFNVLCKPSVYDYRMNEDKVSIEGVVNSNVLYLANNDEKPVFCSAQEIPFKHAVDVKGINEDMSCEIGLDVEHCNYSVVSANEVEIRLVITLGLKVMKQIPLPVVVKVNENSLDEKKLASQPSITIYFAQPGDNLWKIAKKYYVTLEDIQVTNNMADHDMMVPGQQVIIPKRIVE